MAQVRGALGASRFEEVFAAGYRRNLREAVAAVRDQHSGVATALIEEADAISEVTGTATLTHAAMVLAGLARTRGPDSGADRGHHRRRGRKARGQSDLYR